ncbi:glycosyltransferase [Rhizobium sp. TH2]|uniref:glycosyltransferase n=1 Tax=Rhizobium sp. TH2 TaxID=2775403 RepID=UPI0021571193|nr:glycosyltransferase [Rhizobium sp. TH2]UVC08139.1 glycosyltransferase [Rhizobium sp. TH2]
MPSSKRILQIAHSHPRFHPGGTELTALALHREALEQGLDSWYLGALDGTQITPNQGTMMIALTPDQRESALFVNNFIRFKLEQQEHHGLLREFAEYLKFVRPDVVHIHHVLNFGLEALHVLRNVLPEAKIILSIHDFYLICANNGQLYKHDKKQRCPGPTMDQCLKCFPNRNANDFAMRALDIRNALSLCDNLVSPSYFLKDKLDRYLGVPMEISVVENGYLGSDPAIADLPVPRANGGPVFGYFGNISAVKGLADLLDAADLLIESGKAEFSIHVHGAQLFEDKFLADRMEAAKLTLGRKITFFGGYQSDELVSLLANVDCMVFPSVWWENAPLVVYEALHAGRQVIAYPHGGAPEILERYGAGIIAERSDPAALAEAMAKVIDNLSLTEISLNRPIPLRSDLLAAYGKFYFG